MKKKVSRPAFTAAQIHAACDQLATPPRAKKPLASLARATSNLEPYIKEQMPSTKGLARDPLDAVAYANPLGYLPEIRALADKGADDFGLLSWVARMETIAVYCAARVLERVLAPEPDAYVSSTSAGSGSTSARGASRAASTRGDASGSTSARASGAKSARGGTSRATASQGSARTAETVKALTVPDEDARVIVSDLTVTGDLRNGGVLVVLGKLTVSGVIWDRTPDCQLVVLGPVTCRAANLSGGLAIRGDLGCATALYANDHGNTMFVSGHVVAPLVILDDKSLRAKGITANIKLDSRSLRKATVEKAKKLLVADLFRDDDDDDDGDALPFDLDVLLPRLMKAGQPIWRAR